MFEIASQLMVLAYLCNDDPRIDGDPCVSAFRAAKQVLSRCGLDGEAIVDMAISSGECSPEDLMEYAGVYPSEHEGQPCVRLKGDSRSYILLKKDHE